jgi:hypothetical protein
MVYAYNLSYWEDESSRQPRLKNEIPSEKQTKGKSGRALA